MNEKSLFSFQMETVKLYPVLWKKLSIQFTRQVTAMGMTVADSLQFEDLAKICEEEERWEFMVVLAPLQLPKATGSPFNPIAIL
jgi:hypothetical protein